LIQAMGGAKSSKGEAQGKGANRSNTQSWTRFTHRSGQQDAVQGRSRRQNLNSGSQRGCTLDETEIGKVGPEKKAAVDRQYGDGPGRFRGPTPILQEPTFTVKKRRSIPREKREKEKTNSATNQGFGQGSG